MKIQPITMDEELELLTSRTPPAPIFRKDRHLSSALLISEIQYLLKYRNKPEALKQEHKQLVAYLDKHNIIILHPRHLYSWLMSNTTRCVTQSRRQELNAIIQSACLALDISVLDYVGLKTKTTLPYTALLYTIYDVKCAFDDLFDEVTYNTAFELSWKLGHIRGIAYGNLHILHVTQREAFILTHAHLAGLRDMINSWFDILLYGLANEHKYEGVSLYKEITVLITHMTEFTKCHTKYHHKLLKAWPSLVIASILRDVENDDRFMLSLQSDFAEVHYTAIYKYLTRPIKSSVDVHIALELSGLWKCFGHPIVDMDKSVKNWIGKGSVLKTNLEPMSESINNMFLLTFCKNFYLQKRVWPNIDYRACVSARIVENIKAGTWNETNQSPWHSSEFHGIVLEKNFTFDYHVDISDLLADKSIIPEKAQWIHEYDKQAHRTLYGFFPKGPLPTSKSVIIRYLETPIVSVKDILDLIERNVIPESWRIIVGVAKEREQKEVDARFFAKMTFEMRLYQTVTECNIADQIFPYVPQQSMTMREEKLLRVIHRMTTPHTPVHGVKHKFIVIDFSSWCTQFRLELTTNIFQSLDSLFGLVNIYSFTHIFPLLSHIIFQDRFCPPKQSTTGNPEEGTRCHFGPEAWQEGLRQKGWTLATIMLILLVAETCNTSASLLGQGDNQVILLRIPPSHILDEQHHTATSYVDDFVEKLSIAAEQAGIPIKEAETWRSSYLFEYSREYHFKGAQVSSALKRVSRLASEANQSIPSLNADLSGFFSTGAAAASKDIIPGPAYLCTVIEALHLIRRKMTWLRLRPIEVNASCLLVTRMLGGLPIELYSQFCTRAVQDLLSTNMHLIKTAQGLSGMSAALSIWICMRKSSHPDYETLIKDPQSLPLLIPTQPENILRREIKKGVPDLVKNNLLKALFTQNMDLAKDQLIHTLMKIRPVNPRLLNKLFALSNPGLQLSYLGRFSNTRSIQRVAFSRWTNELDLINWIRVTESAISRHYEGQRGNYSIDTLLPYLEGCTARGAYTLRSNYWGLALEGITMPAQQEQTRLERWDTLPYEWQERSILLSADASVVEDVITTKGTRNTYFGSETRMRVRRAPLQVVEVGTMVSSIKQLMELHGWVKGNIHITNFLECLIKEKTDLDLATLLQYTRPVYSGTLSHRLACPALRRGGMSNQCLTFSSHCLINSDTAIKYAKQGENYTICFQSVYLKELSVLAQRKHLGENVAGHWAIVFACEECTALIPSEEFHLEDSTYLGYPIPLSINELTPKFQPTRLYSLDAQVTGALAYSVHMARKFVLWFLTSVKTGRLSTLESRPMEDTLTAPFFNLTEFKHLNCTYFLNSILFYFFLYDERTYFSPHLIWEPLLSGTPSKEPFDVLLDTVVKCGLLSALSSVTLSCRPITQSKYHLRETLAECLSFLLKQGPDVVILSYAILTPDDTEASYMRTLNMILRSLGAPCIVDKSFTKEECKEWITVHCPQYDIDHYLKITVSEEECTAFVRNTVVDIPLFQIGVAPLPRDRCVRERSESVALNIKRIPRPWITFLNPTIYDYSTYLAGWLLRDLRLDWKGKTLTVWNDHYGELYSLLCHLALEHRQSDSAMYLRTEESTWEQRLDQGPLACFSDGCGIGYDKVLYNYYLLTKDPIIPSNIVVILNDRTKQLPKVKPGAHVIMEIVDDLPNNFYTTDYRACRQAYDDHLNRWWIEGVAVSDNACYPVISPQKFKPDNHKTLSYTDSLVKGVAVVMESHSCCSVLNWTVSKVGYLPRDLNGLSAYLLDDIQVTRRAYSRASVVVLSSTKGHLLEREGEKTQARSLMHSCLLTVAAEIVLLNMIKNSLETRWPLKGYVTLHSHQGGRRRWLCFRESCDGVDVDVISFSGCPAYSDSERLWRLLISYLRVRTRDLTSFRVSRVIINE
nr:MAG: RNA-dependent RNA polymerase [Beetle nyamivirus]